MCTLVLNLGTASPLFSVSVEEITAVLLCWRRFQAEPLRAPPDISILLVVSTGHHELPWCFLAVNPCLHEVSGLLGLKYILPGLQRFRPPLLNFAQEAVHRLVLCTDSIDFSGCIVLVSVALQRRKLLLWSQAVQKLPCHLTEAVPEFL